jgi:CheY-like chemotaxis protein
MQFSSTPPDDKPPSRKSPRILCADDSPEIRQALSHLVAAAGATAEFAHDGQDALDFLTARLNGFDLLITDHEMPRLDGLGLVRSLRERGFAGRIIVFASPLEAPVSRGYRDLRVDAIFAKPFDSLKLLDAIKALCN